MALRGTQRRTPMTPRRQERLEGGKDAASEAGSCLAGERPGLADPAEDEQHRERPYQTGDVRESGLPRCAHSFG